MKYKTFTLPCALLAPHLKISCSLWDRVECSDISIELMIFWGPPGFQPWESQCVVQNLNKVKMNPVIITVKPCIIFNLLLELTCCILFYRDFKIKFVKVVEKLRTKLEFYTFLSCLFFFLQNILALWNSKVNQNKWCQNDHHFLLIKKGDQNLAV